MDRAIEIRVRNARMLADATLRLAPGLTVAIGQNGSGKSTLLECIEVLRKSSEPNFIQTLYDAHRGLHGLLRKGEEELALGISFDGPAGRLDFDVCLRRDGSGGLIVVEEILSEPDSSRPFVYSRRTSGGDWFLPDESEPSELYRDALKPDQLALTNPGRLAEDDAVNRTIRALGNLEVHLPFETRAMWAAQTIQQPALGRGSTIMRPTRKLDLLARNLPNAWQALKNNNSSKHWDHTLAIVRLGLGDVFDNVSTIALDNGTMGLQVFRTDAAGPIDAADLSDGQLAWLAFVALVRLNPGRTLLAIDEPELHMHPSLLGRVIALLQSPSAASPVFVTTHSDRVLELVNDPVESIRVCEVADGHATIESIDPARLAAWLEDYQDVVELRREGVLDRVLTSEAEDSPPVDLERLNVG